MAEVPSNLESEHLTHHKINDTAYIYFSILNDKSNWSVKWHHKFIESFVMPSPPLCLKIICGYLMFYYVHKNSKLELSVCFILVEKEDLESLRPANKYWDT